MASAAIAVVPSVPGLVQCSQRQAVLSCVRAARSELQQTAIFGSLKQGGDLSLTSSACTRVAASRRNRHVSIGCTAVDQALPTLPALPSALALPASGMSFLLLQALAGVPSAGAETIFPAVAFLTGDEVETTFYLILFFGFYFLVAPLGVYNYLRLRWYKRNMPETFLQYLLFFLFFPGMLLWAPFINFRRFPRDQSEI